MSDAPEKPAPDGASDPPRPAPSRPRRGAKPGNQNAVKHGGRASRSGLALTVLGKKYRSIYQAVWQFRKAVEAELTTKLGRELGVIEHARVQTIARLEASVRLLEQQIKENPEMPAEQLRQNRTMANQNSRERDNLLSALLNPDGKADVLRWDEAIASRSQRSASE